MEQHKPPHYDAAMGKDETLKVLRELQERFERGEIHCAAVRLFKADGTWEDVVVGGNEDERAEALANLQSVHARAN
jgi:hypothetical protein